MKSREQAETLAHLVHLLRPEWDEPGIFAALKDLAGRDPFETTMRAVRAAGRPDCKTPGVIALNGPHAREPQPHERPVGRGPSPDQECQTHPGQYAASCSGCAADRIARAEQEADQRHEAAARRATYCEHDMPRAECVPCRNRDPEAERRHAERDKPGTVTAKQIRRLHVGFHEAGLENRTEYLAYCQARIDRYVDTTKALSLNEAGHIIESLDAIVALENRPPPQQQQEDPT